MSEEDDLQRALAEARARGAVIINDAEPGRGFQDDPLVCELDPETEKRLAEAEDRARNAKQNPGIQEEAQRIHQLNEDAVRKFRFRHQEDYDEKLWTPGRILWMGRFLNLLQKIRPAFFYAEISYLGLRGLGIVEDGKPKYTGMSVQNGNMAEWSLLAVDAHGLPVRERYRGWRTVLLGLIRAEFITEAQCDQVFGKPVGPRSKPWYRGLYELRNNRCGECRKELCDCLDRFDHLRADKHAYPVPSEIAQGKRMLADDEPPRIFVP